MKNVHLIATDKPSRLWITKLGNLTRCHDIKPIKEALGNNVSIYITDNSEIKDGDWVITKGGLLGKVITEFAWHFYNSKKIILTTDLDLLKEDVGIQAIDDEFLEWFCSKNGKVDFVEMTYENDTDLFGYDFCYYKIIIPKEEPKQGTMSEAIKQVIDTQLKKETLEEAAWFKTEQIETAVNVNGDMSADEIKACRKKLIVLHECGEDKQALIGQLETMILGLKTNFDCFAS